MKISDDNLNDSLNLKSISKCFKANKNKVKLKCKQKSKIRKMRLKHQQERSQTFLINEFDDSGEILATENNITSCQLEDNANVNYVVINNLTQGYTFEKNWCLKVRMIDFSSNWQIQVDGYRCNTDETVNISTCFGYCSSIIFVPMVSIDSESKNRENNVEFVKNELKEQYHNFISYHQDSLFDGKSVLLRIEIDSVAMNKYKLVLHYIEKSMTDRKKCKKISTYSSQDLSKPLVIDGTNYSSLNAKMDKIYDSIEISSGDIILICGSSNCGKSSLIHHLINRYISRKSPLFEQQQQNAAYYLECDPGQTEFAPCGILSLVKIENSIIQTVPGSKFMFHQAESFSLTDNNSGRIISKILGITTPSFYATKYVDLIGQLLDHYLSLRTNAPLFINTMGWIEDVGLDLLIKIIQMARPTLVIRIHNNDDDFPPPVNPLQEFKDRSMRKYLSAFKDVCSVNNLRKRFNFKFFYASSCSLNQYSPFKSSSLRREINQLAYLTSGLFPTISYLPFYAVEPVKLSLSNLFVHVLNSPKIAPYLIYDLLNVSWVILGNIQVSDSSLDPIVEKPGDHSSSACCNIKLLSHLPNSAVCLGCGIVRNVDPKENCVYVTLPHIFSNPPVDTKDQVNLIVLPNLISIPTGLLIEQFLYLPSSMLPYLSSH